MLAQYLKSFFLVILQLFCFYSSASELSASEKNFAKRGGQLLRLGRNEEAARVLTEALKQNPYNDAALFDRAAALLRAKQYGDAFSDFSLLCRRTPNDFRVWHNAGICARYMQKYALATAHLDKSVELHPKNSAALMELGYCNFMQKDYRNAERNYSAALTVNPQNAETLYSLSLAQRALNKISQAIASINLALRINPANANFRLQRGYLLLAAGQKSVASYDSRLCDSDLIRLLPRKFIKTARNNSANYPQIITDASAAIRSESLREAGLMLRGYCYYLSGDYSRATTDFSLVIAKTPEPAAFYHRAAALLQKGELTKAREDILRALQSWPNNLNYCLLEGVILTRARKYDEAIDVFSAILSKEPNNAEALFNRATAYLGISQNYFARQDLQSAVESDPTFAEAWFQMGTAIMRIVDSSSLHHAPKLDTLKDSSPTGIDFFVSGAPDIDTSLARRAIQCYTNAIRLQCYDPEAYISRASCFTMLKDYYLAIEDARQASKLDPDNCKPYIEEGLANFGLHETNAMLAAFKTAARLSPGNALARFSYGFALFLKCDSIYHAANGRIPSLDSFALAAYKEFLSADKLGSGVETRAMLGISYFFLRKYKLAIDLIETDFGSETALYYRALSLAEYGDINAAIFSFRKYLAHGSRREYRNNAAAALENLLKQY